MLGTQRIINFNELNKSTTNKTKLNWRQCSHGYFYHDNCDDAKVEEEFWFFYAGLVYEQLLKPLGW